MTRPIILCNGAEMTPGKAAESLYRLDYLDEATRNVKLLLPDFVKGVYHLPDRFLDLLEIASSYVYAADRMTSRGSRDAVEFGYIRVFQRTFYSMYRERY